MIVHAQRTLAASVLAAWSLTIPVNARAQEAVAPDVPSRVVLNITETPATSVAVTWRMAAVHADAVVEFAATDGGTAFEKRATAVPATWQKAPTETGATVHHYAATLSSLTPATRYVYRVGRTDAWSEWNQFTTAAAGAVPTTFVWFGDPQDDLLEHCARVFREAFRTAPDAGFWLFSGDLTTEPQDALIGELFDAGSPMFRMLPMALTPGNHDMAYQMENGVIVRNAAGKRQRTSTVSPLWNAHYTLPANGPADLAETSYSFDYQGVRIILINTNDKLTEQRVWVEERLANNPQAWTVVAFHHPLYSSGRDRDDKKTRKAFLDLFERYDVDLVLAGHDHTYARSLPLLQDAVAPAGRRGVVYVNSASGPKFYPYSPTYRHLMAKTGDNLQLFQVLRVDGGTLTFKAFTAAGTLFDEFVLTKPRQTR